MAEFDADDEADVNDVITVTVILVGPRHVFRVEGKLSHSETRDDDREHVCEFYTERTLITNKGSPWDRRVLFEINCSTTSSRCTARNHS